MYKAISAVRDNKLSIDTGLFTEEVLRLQSERALALYNLYDMGASYSPSILDKKEIFEYLMEQSKEDCGYLVTRNGFIPWTFEMIDYALIKAKDETFKTVLQNYEIYKYCDEQLHQLYSACIGNLKRLNTSAIGTNKVINGISANMNVASDKLSLNNRYLSVDAFRECLVRKPNTRLVDIDLRGDFLKGLAVAVGVNKDAVIKAEYSNESLFSKGMTFEEEKQIVWGLADGAINADGTYGALLGEALHKISVARSTDTLSDNLISVRSKTFIEGIEFTIQTLRDFENKYKNFGFRYLWVSTDYITAEVNKGFIDSDDILLAFRPERKVGYFVQDYTTGERLPDANLMRGISGEYISEYECVRNNYFVTGFPILVVSRTETRQTKDGVSVVFPLEKYYSILDVHYKEPKESDYTSGLLEPRVGNREEISPKSLEKTYSACGVSNFEDFKNILYNTDRVKLFYKKASGLADSVYKRLVVSILINYILSQIVIYDVSFIPIPSYPDEALVNATADALIAFNAIWRG